MSNFDDAIKVVLENEGGFSDNPLDRGGKTNFGISENLLKRIKYAKPVEELTLDDAKQIYKEVFWDYRPFKDVASQLVCNELFDFGVNVGLFRMTMILQEALNKLGFPVKKDGSFGAQTLTAINQCSEKELIDALRVEQKLFYKNLVARHPEQKPFLRGWLNRVDEL